MAVFPKPTHLYAVTFDRDNQRVSYALFITGPDGTLRNCALFYCVPDKDENNVPNGWKFAMSERANLEAHSPWPIVLVVQLANLSGHEDSRTPGAAANLVYRVCREDVRRKFPCPPKGSTFSGREWFIDALVRLEQRCVLYFIYNDLLIELDVEEKRACQTYFKGGRFSFVVSKTCS